MAGLYYRQTAYKQAVAFWNALVNYEKQRDKLLSAVPKLQRMRRLLAVLGVDLASFRIIQIAGTKGKGSTAVFLASVLSAHRLKTGLFTSPHLASWRERIRVIYRKGGEIKSLYISEGDIAEFWRRYSTAVIDFYRSPAGRGLSFFELATALGFYYFRQKKTDVVILETGLGGEWDATNAARKNELAVITPVDYDHEAVLGHTLASIAAAKGGIVKKGGIVITNQPRPAALKVVRSISAARKAALYVQEKDFYPYQVQIGPQKSRFWFCFRGEEYGPFSLRQKGDYQVENAVLALAAARVFLRRHEREFSFSLAKTALAGITLPGRWEIVKRRPLVILDIAHNSLSLQRLFCNLEYYYRRRLVVIFALSCDKKAGRIGRVLDRAETIILPVLDHPRLMPASVLKRRLKVEKGIIVPGLREAVKQGLGRAGKEKLLLVTGSTYLVAEARGMLCRKSTI